MGEQIPMEKHYHSLYTVKYVSMLRDFLLFLTLAAVIFNLHVFCDISVTSRVLIPSFIYNVLYITARLI